MAKPLKNLLRKFVFSSRTNLSSLDDPYEICASLLKNSAVENILDAGASYGRVAQRLARPFPNANVHLFEPNPDYQDPLTTLCSEESRYHYWPMALASECGEMELHFTVSRGTTSRYRPNERADENWGKESEVVQSTNVPAVSIDEWARDNEVGPIRFMKFDIQSGELQALQGASESLKNDVLLVYTEIFFNPMYEGGALFGDLDQLLREHGFLLYNLYKVAEDENGMLLHANAIFVHAGRLTL